MPAKGLRVNRYDFVALHSMWRIFLGLMCLSTSGNYTQVKFFDFSFYMQFNALNTMLIADKTQNTEQLSHTSITPQNTGSFIVW